MGKVYVIISGKGGVGKTTSAINLGLSINELGKEVIIVDANFNTPNIGLHLGSPIVPTTLNNIINDKAKIEEAIYEHESGIKIMPSSLSMAESNNMDISKLSDITKKLRKISDHVFIDSAAGIGEDAKTAIRAADEVIIITNPEISAVTDALKAAKIAEKMNKKVLGFIVNRHEGKDWEMSLDTIKDMLDVPMLGIIPEDDSIKESQRMKHAVVHTHPKSKAARAYRRVARRILGPEYMKAEHVIEKKAEGFFKKFMKKLGF